MYSARAAAASSSSWGLSSSDSGEDAGNVITFRGGPWKMVARVLRTSGFVALVGRSDTGLVAHAAGPSAVGRSVARGRLASKCRSCFGDSACAHLEEDKVKESMSLALTCLGIAEAWKCLGYKEAYVAM